MKIVFSRKGFDSENGGIPSPIFPDGAFCSLPLLATDDKSNTKFDDLLAFDGHSMGKVVRDLSNGNIRPSRRIHFDPDLNKALLPRLAGWRPICGRVIRSASHLRDHGVGIGALILFFGWFRRVELQAGRYHFVRGSEDLHVLFGWLQIGEILAAGPEMTKAAPKWARYHPHFLNNWGAENAVYLASDTLSLAGLSKRIPGGGAFTQYSPELRLTAPNCTRSIWRLPRSFHPKRGRSPLSRHPAERWTIEGDHTILRTFARWQEAVLDTEQCPEAIDWICDIVTTRA
jgi:hypothetical protein